MSQRQQGPPRPPRERAPQEFPPVIEPRLRDMPGFPGPEIEGGFQRVEGAAVPDRDRTEVLQRAQKVALADDRVRERLAGHRYAALGASLLEDRKEEPRDIRVLALFHDYEAGRTIEVELASAGKELSVARIEEVDYQPAPSDEELERAIALAREDPRLAARVSRELTPMPILVSAVEPGDRHHGTRRIAVSFGRPDERLPRVQALVDLGAQRVLGVGVDVRHGAAEAEGFAATEEAEGGDR